MLKDYRRAILDLSLAMQRSVVGRILQLASTGTPSHEERYTWYCAMRTLPYDWIVVWLTHIINVRTNSCCCDDIPQALENYSKALELNPDFAMAYYSRAQVYVKQQQNDTAIADYTAAIKADPDLANAYYSRVQLYQLTGDHKGEVADITEYLRRSRANLGVQERAKALLARGKAQLSLKRYEGALEVFQCGGAIEVKMGGSLSPRWHCGSCRRAVLV